MVIKTSFVVLFLASVLCVGCVTNANKAQSKTVGGDEITEAVIKQFTEIAQVPRPTNHEEKISEYLYDWAKQRNLEVTKDAVNNIVIEVPATKGMEKLPKVALQAHMDMVFASVENLDPLTTPIKVVRDGDFIKSDGRTSLGTDDGIGLSIALCAADGLMEHGPLRVIVTVNEEMGMKGVQNIDAATVADIDYMINIDSEESNTVTVSSAGGHTYYFEKENALQNPTGNAALNISLSGLVGGHSGVEINKRSANAIVLLAEALNDLTDKGYSYEIASLKGGDAENAIPKKADSTIVVSSGDANKIKSILTETFNSNKVSFKKTDPDMAFEIKETSIPAKTISVSDSSSLMKFTSGIINGVYTMSKDIDGLVESSSNLGLVELKDGVYTSAIYVRSSVLDLMNEICSKDESLAKNYGIKYKDMVTADPWKFNPDSVLLERVKKSYKKLFGEEIDVVAVHAGLECGTFSILNPNLDIISIGPDVMAPHTVEEACKISSVRKTWDLIQDIVRF